jgi:hypothetical protein
MDWQQVIIKILIGGIAGAGAKVASTAGILDWGTLWAVAGGGFVLGIANVLTQLFNTPTVAAKPTSEGFWKRLKKSF